MNGIGCFKQSQCNMVPREFQRKINNTATRKIDELTSLPALTSLGRQPKRAFLHHLYPDRDLWQQTGDHLPAVSSVKTEVRVRGQHDRVGQSFGHPHQASIGQAHWQIGVFVH
jgi:hypothetical protein